MNNRGKKAYHEWESIRQNRECIHRISLKPATSNAIKVLAKNEFTEFNALSDIKSVNIQRKNFMGVTDLVEHI